MRHLALLLVLANLAFAAWIAWFAEPAVVPIVTSPPRQSPPAIVLVNELPPTPAATDAVPSSAPESSDLPEQAALPGSSAGIAPGAATAVAAATVASPPEVAAADPPQRCVSVGPFRELSQAATAAATLRADGHAPEQRVVEGDIWVGYWVYLPGIPTRERAAELLTALQQQGISDSYVTPGDEGYLISLGVFSEIGRAGARREQVRAIGQEPLVVDRTRRGTVYWIDLALPAGQALDLESLQTPGRITRLEQRPCDAEL
jgi:hypothetical protein